VVLDQSLVPRVLYGNYAARRFVFAARFWPFLPLLFAANPDLLPGDSDKVTGTAIIREINIARQTRRFTRISSNKPAKTTPVGFA